MGDGPDPKSARHEDCGSEVIEKDSSLGPQLRPVAKNGKIKSGMSRNIDKADQERHGAPTSRLWPTRGPGRMMSSIEVSRLVLGIKLTSTSRKCLSTSRPSLDYPCSHP